MNQDEWPISIAGQNPELGSLYRSGVAAYLAAHGLAGEPVPQFRELDDNAVPLSLQVESDMPVDDLLLRTEKCEYWIQAKRTCGFDKPFRDTVAQWVRAVRQGDLGPQVHLVLVTGKAKSGLLQLASALQRRRQPHAQRPSGREKKALDVLEQLAGSELSATELADLLDRALIIELPSESEDQAAFREAARLMEAGVVELGQGLAAMKALRGHFQSHGARRWGDGRSEWRTALLDAGLTLLSGPESSWSALQTRIEEKLLVYANCLTACRDEIRLSLLADDLPPLLIPRLLSTFQVSWTTHQRTHRSDLASVARRWNRVVVSGLPGAGKSSALEQLGAVWAGLRAAPVPILVRLGPLSKHVRANGLRITLPAIVRFAIMGMALEDQEILGTELIRRCHDGSAVLLLDGLDECRHSAPQVVDDLERVLRGLSPFTGVVISTRPSALRPVARLNLPVVRMDKPYRLESRLSALLDHVAKVRLADDERAAWTTDKRSRLADIQQQSDGLMSVPLTATLLTLCLADDDSSAPTRANVSLLLRDTVDRAVRRWESAKHDDRPHEADLQPGMLIDSFVAIGHAFFEHDGLDRSTAIDEVTKAYVHSWSLSERAAEELAASSLDFWDDRLGVFVETSSKGTLEPRSQLYADLAQAMWISTCPAEEQEEWARVALEDEYSFDALALAAGFSNFVVGSIVSHGLMTSEAFDTSAAVLVSSGVRFDAHNETAILDAAKRLLTNPDQGLSSSDGARADNDISPQWPVAWRLASLPFSEDSWNHRREILAQLSSTAERLQADAIAAVSEYEFKSDSLAEWQVRAWREFVMAERPSSQPPAPRRRPSRRIISFGEPDGWRPPSGFGQALIGAARYLPSIDRPTARAIYRASDYCGLDDNERLSRIFDARKLESFVEDLSQKRWSAVFGHIGELPTSDLSRVFLQHLARAGEPATLHRAELWTLERLCTVAHFSGLISSSLRGLNEAFTSEFEDVSFLINLVVDRLEVDPAGLAAEALAALVEYESDGGEREIDGLLCVPFRPGDSTAVRVEDYGEYEVARLVSLACWGGEIPKEVARTLLRWSDDERVAVRIADNLGQVALSSVDDLSFYAASLTDTPVLIIERLAGNPVGPIAVAGAKCSRRLLLSDETEAAKGLLKGQAGSADLSVRMALLADVETVIASDQLDLLLQASQEAPEIWTCGLCGEPNHLDVFECGSCPDGCRPRVSFFVKSRVNWASNL